MPTICVVNGCCNRSNREKWTRYYRVPKVLVHKGDRCRRLSERRRKLWLENIRSKTGAAESHNARVCSDHFVQGHPSSLIDTESVDWAPTLNLGNVEWKPLSEALRLREERMRSREELQEHTEGAESQDPDPIQKPCERQDVGCQTELSLDDLEKMEMLHWAPQLSSFIASFSNR